ncbi:MAG: hypothetical protein M1823_000122 [Watsoniomyces obsoletus]|nr:MAG: hypothetical protein M1823_000122 [Watsoniomyces obsoletus]
MAAFSFRGRKRKAESELQRESPEPIGLHVLSDGAKDAGRCIDVVTVHGLEGHWKNTWTAEDGNFWIRDSLPQELQNAGFSARIMSFGYDASLRLGAGLTDIHDQAGILLNRLYDERDSDELQKRPLLFICHSLGGLVMKKALILAWENPNKYKDLSESVKAAVFFGVPHRGADIAYWASLSVTLVNAVAMGSAINKAYLDALQRNSTVWCDISHSFVQRVPSLKIRTFYETRKVVDKDSAIMLQSNEEAVAIEANHLDLCKFRENEPQKYKPVWKAIVRLAKEIVGGREVLQYQPSEEEKKCLQTLYTSHYKQHKARNPSRARGTCTWFLQHPHYNAWVSAEESSILWVSADPGCGKSVLASFLVDELVDTASNASISSTVCYFFFKDDNDGQRDALSALSAVLHQLLSAQRHLITYAMPDFTNMGERFKDDFLTLWDIFTKIATNFKDENIFCVFDALDECGDSTRNQFTQKLVEFYESPPSGSRVKILVTSRPNRSIEDRLDGDTTIRIKGEDVDISGDVALVVRHQVQEIALKRNLTEAMQTRLMKSLVSNADGTFLWVSLILEMIQDSVRTSEAVLNSLITSIPPSLDAVYEKILSQSAKNDDVRKVLCIILAATRPLTLEEMNVAFCLETSLPPDQQADQDLGLETSIKSTLLALCGPFLRFRDSKVYLVHQTAKEFLLGEARTDDSWKHSISSAVAHGVLAELCMSYLTHPQFQHDPPRSGDWPGCFKTLRDRNETMTHLSRFVFLQYSAENWATHVERCRDDSMSVGAFKLCKVESRLFHTWFTIYCLGNGLHPPPIPRSGIVLSSFFGHAAAVGLHIGAGADVNSRDRDRRTSLHWAVDEGHESIVNFLLRMGAHVNAEDLAGTTPLLLAAANNRRNVTEMLIQNGADVEAGNGSGQTSLHIAAGGGFETVAQLLIQHGAKVEAQDSQGQTGMHYAAYDSEAVARLLLENGASVEAGDNNGTTALHIAASRGQEAIADLLLHHGATVQGENYRGRTALHEAAFRGYEAVVGLLLKHGADIEARDPDGKTALHLSSNKAVADLLLLHGANVDREDRRGRISLHEAAFEEYKAVVRLLLDHGANIETRDEDGKTAFRLASIREVAASLLQHGATIEADEYGQTALHQAARRGNEPLVDLLLQHGANIEKVDKNGRTALHLAVIRTWLSFGTD